MGSSPIHALPAELLFQIFGSFLSTHPHIHQTNHRSDLKKRTTLRLVCRAWNALVLDCVTDITAANQATHTHMLPVAWPSGLRWLEVDGSGPVKRGDRMWREGVEDDILDGLEEVKGLRGFRMVNCLRMSDRILERLPTGLLMLGLVNQITERSIRPMYTADVLAGLIQRCSRSLVELEADAALVLSPQFLTHLSTLFHLTHLTLHLPSSLENKGRYSHLVPTCYPLPLASLPPTLRSLIIHPSDRELTTQNTHLHLDLSILTSTFPSTLTTFSCALLPCTSTLLLALPHTLTNLTLGWGLNERTISTLTTPPPEDPTAPVRGAFLATLTHLTLYDSRDISGARLLALLRCTPELETLRLETYNAPGLLRSPSFLSSMDRNAVMVAYLPPRLRRFEFAESWVMWKRCKVPEGCVVVDHFRRFVDEVQRSDGEGDYYKRMLRAMLR
ncbi:hypothetical protein BC938DRAFT_474932 [Jimgerdemannia flammicorona]|uniref:Uncharacterized protein n=1 Tax=Jimgerdemannia flammicorona TaxID=994334 RepID=A0A433Q1D4_9FUNG|nr:hypothetical protein BC938DRAFT_474932 [Jimgerdemannia flammicorona]